MGDVHHCSRAPVSEMIDLYCVEWDVKLYYTIPCGIKTSYIFLGSRPPNHPGFTPLDTVVLNFVAERATSHAGVVDAFSGSRVGDDTARVPLFQLVCRRTQSSSSPGHLYPGVAGRFRARPSRHRGARLRLSRSRQVTPLLQLLLSLLFSGFVFT